MLEFQINGSLGSGKVNIANEILERNLINLGNVLYLLASYRNETWTA